MNELKTGDKMENEIVKNQSGSPDALISLALSSGADLEKLEKVLKIKTEWEALEARKAYVIAMASFKEDVPKVTKDKDNLQYKSKYTTLGNLVNTVTPVLSKHGFSASWNIAQNGIIKVACKITHKQGHFEIAEASAPADDSGSKNKVQQIKSTITYLKTVTFESICGLASSDANCDDDANGAEIELIDEKQLGTLLDYINATETNAEKFLAHFKIESLETMPKSTYPKALNLLMEKEKALKTPKARK